MPGSLPTLVESYRTDAAAHRRAQERQARRSRIVSYLRLGVFLAAAAVLLSAFPNGGRTRILLSLGGFLAFFGLVYWHSRIEALERWFGALGEVHEEAAWRIERNWDHLPPSSLPGPGPSHAYAEDLDLFGRASLFQLLGSVGTEAGRQTLGSWLLAPAAPDVIRARQAALRELAPMRRERAEFAALGRLVEPSRRDLEVFFEWAEGKPWLLRRPWLLWLARLLAVLNAGLASLQIAGITDRPLWLYSLLASMVLLASSLKRIHDTFHRAFSRDRLFQQHSTLFARISAPSVTSPLLAEIQARLRQSGLTASREMARLASIRQYADLRLVALFHFVIAVVTLWDFHVLAALERWQLRTAPHLRRWFDALGEFDAVAALAWLWHDHPEWAMPEIDPASDRLEAVALGHPLIADAVHVPNDVTIGPPGSFLLVTGSNMSGKSTLLRAIGVNVALAQAGGPVCARRLRMPPLSVCTSMRIEDSLEEGISYFMAALQRLKLVVSSARAVRPGDPLLLYLLDEVLQGTNSAERQVAVRRILRHLLSLRVIGAVTTHDLELAACEELAAACQAVHFSEGVEIGEGAEAGARLRVSLLFDYRLKPGIATSRNALKLVELVGLGDPRPG